MSEITTIGLDLAKHVFQVHGIDAEGTTVLRKRLRRGQVVAFFSRLPRCLVGLEACATAHYWARELQQNVVPTTTPAGKVMFQMMGVLAELRARQDPRTSPC